MTDFYQLSSQQQVLRLTALAHNALQEWAIEARSITLIKYRENAVFKVTTEHSRFALRIHRPGYHHSRALRSELLWLDALAEAGIPVPQVIPTSGGELCIRAEAPGVPEPRDVDLFAWIEGDMLSINAHTSSAQLTDTYRKIGEIAAQLHNQSSAWSPPATFFRHAWDSEGLVGEAPFWGRFWEHPALSQSQRQLLLNAREKVAQTLATLDKSARHYSLIHADFVPENLMQDGAAVRLIDFDDAGFGWHMFELATALFFHIRTPSYRDISSALFAGYRSYRALSAEDEKLLDTFLAARGFTYLGWLMDRAETETARHNTQSHIDIACYQAQKLLAEDK
ncbi:MAG: phosphotransferase enzyme family protein [Pseudomonadales bacterium]